METPNDARLAAIRRAAADRAGQAVSVDQAAVRQGRVDDYVAAERKSPLGAFLLAVVLGPLGLLYASPLGGVIALLISVGLAMISPVLVVLVWVVCVLAAPVAASDHNKRVRARAELLAG